MKKYRFEKAITADGPDGQPRRFAAGQVVAESDVLPGCLAVLITLHQVSEHVEPPEKPAEKPAEKPKSR